jgi:3-hydroxyacyl-CoA dehydrogenase
MNECATYERRADVAAIWFDNPPVNVLSPAVVQGLDEGMQRFGADRSARALVICCRGRTFFAGGDITGFSRPGFSTAAFNDLLMRLERLDRPVIAVMHGTVMGGGVEVALACHYRAALPGTGFGLPEVKLGLIPGSLGTQRLPRLVGVEKALDWLNTGRAFDTAEAHSHGLVDRIVTGPVGDAAFALAEDLLVQGALPRRVSDFRIREQDIPAGFFERARAEARRDHPHQPAQQAMVSAVEACLLAFSDGAQVEARLFEELRKSPESRAMRYLFLAERAAAKVDAPNEPVDAAEIITGPESSGKLLATLESPGLRLTARATGNSLVREAPEDRNAVAVNLLSGPNQPIAELVFGQGNAAAAAAIAGLLRRKGYLVVACHSSLAAPLQEALPPGAFDAGEPQETTLTALADVGHELLRRGAALRASDIDVLCTHWLGCPVHLGGPMLWAEAAAGASNS